MLSRSALPRGLHNVENIVSVVLRRREREHLGTEGVMEEVVDSP